MNVANDLLGVDVNEHIEGVQRALELAQEQRPVLGRQQREQPRPV